MTTESHHVINVATYNPDTGDSVFFFRVIVKGSDGGYPAAQAVFNELRSRFSHSFYDIDVTYWSCSGTTNTVLFNERREELLQASIK